MRTRARAAPWLMIGTLVLLVAFLLPARGAALRGDDEWTFEFRGQLLLTHDTFVSKLISGIGLALSHLRPQVLGGAVSDPALYFFDGHPALYRLYLVALTVICGGMLWALVRCLGGSDALAALVVVLFAGAVEFRSYHDPLLGYYGATQWGLLLVLASLLAFQKSLEGCGRRWSVLAVLLFGCGCGMQEYVYPLASVHLGLALSQRRGRQAIRAALPMVVLGVGLMFVGYLGRHGLASSAVPTGYGTSLSPHLVLSSYVTQLLPPLPGSNRLFPEGPIAYFYPLGGNPTAAEYLAGAWRGGAVFGVVVAFALWVRRGDTIARLTSGGVQGRLLAVGIPFWLAPPLLLALSQKYQQELTPGKPYVDVLFQVLGFALVASAALLGLIRVADRRSGAALIVTVAAAALLLGFGAAVDGFNNLRVVALEQPVRHTRDLLETATKNGALNAVPSRSTLLFSGHDMNWPTGNWSYGTNTGEAVLMADSGRNFDVRYAADQTPLTCPVSSVFPPGPCAPPAASAAWVRVRAFRGGGVVIVSLLTSPTAKTIATETSNDLYAYTEQSAPSTPSPPALVGTLRSGRPWSSASLHWAKVRSGADWAIYHATIDSTVAPVAYSLNDPRSAVDFLSLPAPDQDVRIFETKQLLP